MSEPAHNYARVRYDGKVVNARTRAMLDAAAGLFGKPFRLTQGSYNKGVSASAGTHDGGGVVDINTSGMSAATRDFAVQCLRRVGFFAWERVPPAFVVHIHAVAIGDQELAPAARSQVTQGFADRDGLAQRGPDPDKDPYPAWVDRYGKHVSLDRPTEQAKPPAAKPAPAAPTGGAMKLVTRKAWGGPASIGTTVPVRKGIAVHYDGGTPKNLKTHADCSANVKGIHNYHVSKGWSGIGYAWLVCPHGSVFEGRGFDRTQAAQPGGNSSHQSVQFMLGGSQKPTAAMLEAWYQLRDYLYSKGVAKEIRPHNSWIKTSCPGSVLEGLIKDGTLAKVKAAPRKPVSKHEPYPGLKFFESVKSSPVYTAMGKRLVAEGCGLYEEGPGPVLSDVDKRSYEKWQRKLGLKGDSAKWPPGPWSWAKLEVPNVK